MKKSADLYDTIDNCPVCAWGTVAGSNHGERYPKPAYIESKLQPARDGGNKLPHTGEYDTKGKFRGKVTHLYRYDHLFNLVPGHPKNEEDEGWE